MDMGKTTVLCRPRKVPERLLGDLFGVKMRSSAYDTGREKCCLALG